MNNIPVNDVTFSRCILKQMLAILHSIVNKNSDTCKLKIVFRKVRGISILVFISMQEFLNILLRAYVVFKYTVICLKSW